MPIAVQQVNDLGLRLSVSVIGDELLAIAYLRLRDDGLLDTVFYQGVPTLSGFLDLHKRPDVLYLGGFVQSLDTGAVELAGIGWLFGINEMAGVKRCETGFVYFRKFWNRIIPKELTEIMLDYSFGELGMEILFGTTPEPNRAALTFGRRLGFTQLPPVPLYCTWMGKPESAVLSYLTRDHWFNRKEK